MGKWRGVEYRTLPTAGRRKAHNTQHAMTIVVAKLLPRVYVVFLVVGKFLVVESLADPQDGETASAECSFWQRQRIVIVIDPAGNLAKGGSCTLLGLRYMKNGDLPLPFGQRKTKRIIFGASWGMAVDAAFTFRTRAFDPSCSMTHRAVLEGLSIF